MCRINIISNSIGFHTVVLSRTSIASIIRRSVSMRINVSIGIFTSIRISICTSAFLVLAVVLVFNLELVFEILLRYVVCSCYAFWEEGYYANSTFIFKRKLL